MMLYGTSLLFKAIHSVPSEKTPLWEFRVVLIEAINEQDAQEKAEKIGKKSEHSYEAQKGDIVTWKFIQVESISVIESEHLKNGTEVFSQFLSDSTVKSLLAPFDD